MQGNRSRDAGGGIFNGSEATVRLVASTVTGNTAATEGGGIWNDPGDDEHIDPGIVRLRRGSAVTGNTPDDCYGTTAC